MAQAIQPACPICKKEPVLKYRPFCSKRCADIDLGGWLTEKYAVPTNESPDAGQNIDTDSGIE